MPNSLPVLGACADGESSVSAWGHWDLLAGWRLKSPAAALFLSFKHFLSAYIHFRYVGEQFHQSRQKAATDLGLLREEGGDSNQLVSFDIKPIFMVHPCNCCHIQTLGRLVDFPFNGCITLL